MQCQALEHSFALKIAASDIALKEIERRKAHSLYLPTVSLRYDLGYAWALDGEQQAVTIGDTVSAADLSTWRNSLSLSANLLLYDGGAREQRLAGTRHGMRAAERKRDTQLQQLKLQVLEAYLEGLQFQARVAILTRIVELHKRKYRGFERLQEAGTVGDVELRDAALELATGLTRLDDAQISLQKVLTVLSELTGKPFPAEQTHLAALPAAFSEPTGDHAVEQLPPIKAIDEELMQLRAERSAAWRALFPSVGLYGNYRLYGADPENGGESLTDLGARDATVAMVVQWQFSGGRDRLQLERLDEQLRRLGWQRRQRISELQREIGQLRRAVDLMPDQAGHLSTLRQAATAAAQAAERLREQELLAEPEALIRKIELLESSLDETLLRNRLQADALRLQIWQEVVGL